MSDEPEEVKAEEDFVSITEQLIEAKIINTLSVYPQLSYSMLQVGIGTAIPPKMWHPILRRLKQDGHVVETEKTVRSPMNRDLAHRILQLKQNVDLRPYVE